jgi:hypothetical protein
MATKRNRQTFEKLKREQAVKEKRVRKLERRAARAALPAEAAPVDEAAEPADEAEGDAPAS